MSSFQRNLPPGPGVWSPSTVINRPPVGIGQANLMALARPVDADKPCNLFHHARPSSRITPSGPPRRASTLYWRLKRNLPQDFRRGRPAEAQVPSRCSKHRIRRLLPVGRPGSASLQCRPANNRFEGYRDSNPRSLSRRCHSFSRRRRGCRLIPRGRAPQPRTRPISPQPAPLGASGNAASLARPPSGTARPSCPSGSSAVATG